MQRAPASRVGIRLTMVEPMRRFLMQQIPGLDRYLVSVTLWLLYLRDNQGL